MVTKYIDVDNGKWGIILIYDFDIDYEYDNLFAIMQTFGLNRKSCQKSLHILSMYNTGMTISRDDIQMSVVFVGNTTSYSEFWDTIAHELFHVEQAILEYYGTDWEGEPPAYLAGYLLKNVVEKIAIPCME